MVKSVIFDFYGVVIKQSKPLQEILFPLLKKHKGYNYCRKIYHLYALSQISNKIFWQKIGIDNHQEIELLFLRKHQIDKNFNILAAYLAEKKLPIYALSNIPQKWSSWVVEKKNMEKFFNGQVYSWQTGQKKPDLYNYLHLLKKYKIDPSSALFIDDKIENIRAAKCVGLLTCWFNRYNKEVKPYTADFIINSLLQIKKII